MAFKQILISYNVSMGPILTCRWVESFLKNTSLSPDYAMMLVPHFQVWRNCAPPMTIGRAWAHKTCEMSPTFLKRKFCLINVKKS